MNELDLSVIRNVLFRTRRYNVVIYLKGAISITGGLR